VREFLEFVQRRENGFPIPNFALFFGIQNGTFRTTFSLKIAIAAAHTLLSVS